MYLVPTNYDEHLETIAHKIGEFYEHNEKILINHGIDVLPDCFLNCRFLTPEQKMSTNVFLSSIRLELLRLIYKVLELSENNSIKTVLKLFAIYNSNQTINKADYLGSVEMFTLNDEVITACF